MSEKWTNLQLCAVCKRGAAIVDGEEARENYNIQRRPRGTGSETGSAINISPESLWEGATCLIVEPSRFVAEERERERWTE